MQPRPARILSKGNLRVAWDASRDRTRSAGAPGIDRVSARTFSANLDANLERIAKQLRTGGYGFSRLRPFFVPKQNSDKKRMICIPTVSDRLVQRAMVAYLDSNKKLPIYNDVSFGFIRGRGGTNEAVGTALKFRQGHPWCLKTDIESFFDRIPRDYLFDKVTKSLGQKHSLLPLLRKAINCEVSSDKYAAEIRAQKNIKLGLGIRQGMPLSPILANLALAEFDREIIKNEIKMIRYADDLLLFFNSKDDAEQGRSLVVELLKKLGLSIPELAAGNKTAIAGQDDPLTFLGYELCRANGKYLARVSDEQVLAIKELVLGRYSIEELKSKGLNFQDALIALGRSVSAYCGAYNLAANKQQFVLEMKQLGKMVVTNILMEVFGADAIHRISDDYKSFLGIAEFEIDDSVHISNV